MVDQVVAQPLPPPHQQLTNLVNWISKSTGDVHFKPVALLDADAMAGIVGAVDSEAFSNLLKWAAQEGVIEIAGNRVSLGRGALETNPEMRGKNTSAPATDIYVSSKVTKGHCPRCGPAIKALPRGEAERREDDEHTWFTETLRILECCGCGAIYVQRETMFSAHEDFRLNPETGEEEWFIEPDITYWPAPSKRKRPDWVQTLDDQALSLLLDEVYRALDADQRVLAAIGTRTALDRAMELLGATAALDFGSKLRALQDGGVIAETERNDLSVLTDAGSASAHRGWRPTTAQLGTIMDGIEAFLHRTLVLKKTVQVLKDQVPPRPVRPKKAPEESSA